MAYPPGRICADRPARSGPSRVMPRSRAAISSSPDMNPESTTCSPGATPLACIWSCTGVVIATSATAARVVSTLVMTCGCRGRPVAG